MTALQGHLALIGAAVLAAVVIVRFALAGFVRRVLWRRTGFVQSRAADIQLPADSNPAMAGLVTPTDSAATERRSERHPRRVQGARPARPVSAIVVDTQPGARPRRGEGVSVEGRLFGDLAACASARGVAAVFEEPCYRLAYPIGVMDRILAVLAERHAKISDVARVMDACCYRPYANGRERRVFVRLIPDSEGEDVKWHHTAEAWTAYSDPPPRRGLFERGRRAPKVRMRRCLTLYFNGSGELVGWTAHRGAGAANP